MWAMACTFTAPTTNSAKLCPSASSQNAGVRSASRAVKSRVAEADCATAATEAGGCRTPSTVSPMSSGRRRMTIASGMPSTSAATPEASAVVRQPKWTSDQPTAGTNRPPIAKPSESEDSARARQRSNQLMRATLIGKKPHMLEPSAMTMNAP